MDGSTREIPQAALPHTSRLFQDYLERFDRVAAFYSYPPLDPASYRAAAAEIRFPEGRRSALVSALGRLNSGSPSLERLATPGTVAVVTGQQAGLFSGPAYTIYKALTAAKLARRLTAEGLPAVAVFWAATEDHDFAEVSECRVFDAGLRPVTLRSGGIASGGPVGPIALDAPPVAGLREAFAGFPFGGEVVALVEAAYEPGCAMGAAFIALLRHILAGLDLLFLDPLDEGVRELAAPILREAAAAGDLTDLVLERIRRLEAAGYHGQVHVEADSSLLFLIEGGRRVPLRRRDGEYVSRERRYSVAEVSGRAAGLSPNALLRPVVEDFVLPTVAYVGGPAELAYFAQAQPLYARLLGRMPVAVPRAGFTLLDPPSARRMDAWGLSLGDFHSGEDALKERIGAQMVPPDLAAKVRETSESLALRLEDLGAAIAAFDTPLGAAADLSRRKIFYQMGKIERKLARDTARRDSRAAAAAAGLSALVYPGGHLQERFYSILSFLARHGLDLPARLMEAVCLDRPDHRVIVV